MCFSGSLPCGSLDNPGRSSAGLRPRNQALKADPRTLEGEWKSNVRRLNRTCSVFVCQAGRRRHNKREIRVSMVLVTNEYVDLRS